MNSELVILGLKLLSAALAFANKAKNDPEVLKAIVDQARAEGREVNMDDVKNAVDRMHAEIDALESLIQSKKS